MGLVHYKNYINVIMIYMHGFYIEDLLSTAFEVEQIVNLSFL